MADGSAPVARMERQRRRRAIRFALQLNLFLFFVEAGVGLRAGSSALLADSLDMLADAFSYAASLFVVGRGPRWAGAAAFAKGATMLVLGLVVLARTGASVQTGILPGASSMAAMASVAMLGNAICCGLLAGHRGASADLRAAWLCSRNDLLGNAAVLLAAAPTAWLASPWPDAAVGFGIASLLVGTSLGILRAAIVEFRAPPSRVGQRSGSKPEAGASGSAPHPVASVGLLPR